MIPDMSDYSPEVWMTMTHEERMSAIQSARARQDLDPPGYVSMEEALPEFKRSAAFKEVETAWGFYIEEVMSEGNSLAYASMEPSAVMATSSCGARAEG